MIMTAIGPDQVGLVKKISEFISRYGCNIDDSKMAVFCGEFAVIVLISGEGGSLMNVARDYREIEAETGLTIAIKAPSQKRPSGKSSLITNGVERMPPLPMLSCKGETKYDKKSAPTIPLAHNVEGVK